MNYFADHANKEHSIVGIHASWLDHLHLPAEFLTAKTQMLNRIHYSPALQSAGVCAVIITTFWLISAYFNEAFSYENTIYDSERVVLDTGKSWLYTRAGMILLHWQAIQRYVVARFKIIPFKLRGIVTAKS